ncbi:hypothetical protein [Sporosarcina sp. FSL K6-3457]|uniref:hypothetical protein n=1 Tax=Sporosarcina sp. FSL K6-3457 TaxID=2978204 RepID=UPI0030F6429D
MKVDSDSNLFFRLILTFSYLLIIWFPTRPYLFIIPLSLSMIDNSNKNKKLKMLALLLCMCTVFYFFLNDIDVEQQIAISLVSLYFSFSDIIKKHFKNSLRQK